MLTGRYKFEPTRYGCLKVIVEDFSKRGGFSWRPATKRDLDALEPEIADGWRFREERDGSLNQDGKRR